MNKKVLENLPKGVKQALAIDIKRELKQLSGDGYSTSRLAKILNKMGVANKQLYKQADLLEILEFIA